MRQNSLVANVIIHVIIMAYDIGLKYKAAPIVMTKRMPVTALVKKFNIFEFANSTL